MFRGMGWVAAFQLSLLCCSGCREGALDPLDWCVSFPRTSSLLMVNGLSQAYRLAFYYELCWSLMYTALFGYFLPYHTGSNRSSSLACDSWWCWWAAVAASFELRTEHASIWTESDVIPSLSSQQLLAETLTVGVLPRYRMFRFGGCRWELVSGHAFSTVVEVDLSVRRHSCF